MTAPLTHTAPVPLPAMQEPGPAFVREAAAPAAQQAPADTCLLYTSDAADEL